MWVAGYPVGVSPDRNYIEKFVHLRDQSPLLEYGQGALLTVEVVECERRVGTSCWLGFWLC